MLVQEALAGLGSSSDRVFGSAHGVAAAPPPLDEAEVQVRRARLDPVRTPAARPLPHRPDPRARARHAAPATLAQGGEVEVYIESLVLHPVSVMISVQIEPLCSEAELQEFHPANAVLGGAAR